ncbi:MAG: LysR family transcriptional regulator [Aphanocapsa lilacina HA4352-LM1]|jgi:DNA-binding transcriptional LysR family regulator|nr:LysR family transcriptional regulator [Aphanocapsa lilacina HA4352-LM1]
MTLEQLRIFIAVAEHLHFTRAAQTLHLTQPAVSAAIASLEGEYAVPLFHRVGRHVELAEAGRLLLEQARKIMKQVEHTQRVLQELKGLERGELFIAASQTIANYWLPIRLHRFHQVYPGIQVRLTIDSSPNITRQLLEGSADLGLVEGKTEPNAQLTDEEIAGDHLVLIVGRSHPWWDKEHITFADLTEVQWVVRETGSGTRVLFEDELELEGIDPHKLPIALELPSGEMIKAAVEAGAGVAVISELLVTREVKLGTLRTPEGVRLRRPFRLLMHRQRHPTKASLALVHSLSEVTQVL